MFEQMDIDNDDNTTLKEFTDFLVRTHRAKRVKESARTARHNPNPKILWPPTSNQTMENENASHADTADATSPAAVPTHTS